MTYGDHTKQGARVPNADYDKIDSIDWSNAPHNEDKPMDNSTAITLITLEIQAQKVNHLLQLIFTILTCGLWLPVWLIMVVSAGIEVKRLKGKLVRMHDSL